MILDMLKGGLRSVPTVGKIAEKLGSWGTKPYCPLVPWSPADVLDSMVFLAMTVLPFQMCHFRCDDLKSP